MFLKIQIQPLYTVNIIIETSKRRLPQVYNTRAFDYSKQEIFTQYPISFFSQI
jgi:hypothetical protein